MRHAGFRSFALLAVFGLCLGGATLALPVAGQALAQDASDAGSGDIAALQHEVERIAARNPGNVGVALKHLETGRALSLNGDDLFFMASTYKIPMAVRALERVESGDLSLDQLIEIREEEYVEWSVIAERLMRGPAAVSVANLVELTMVLSDNTATDVLLRAVGGADDVTSMVRRYGVEDLTVSRPTKKLLLDFVDYPPLTTLIEEDGLSFAQAWRKMTPADEKKMEALGAKRLSDKKLLRKFLADPRDKATPHAMLSFLEKVWEGDALNAAHTQLIKDIMGRCETGEARIKGKLPVGTVVQHKTGTLDSPAGVTNNAGVIELPDNKGRVAIVVYVKNGDREIPFNEEIIADISQAAYNYFVFTTPAQ